MTDSTNNETQNHGQTSELSTLVDRARLAEAAR